MTKKGKKRQLSETESGENTQFSNKNNNANKISPKKKKFNQKPDALEKDNKQKAIDKVHKKIIEQENSPGQSLKNKKKNKKQKDSAISLSTQNEVKENKKKSKQLQNAEQGAKNGEKSDLIEQAKNSSEDPKLLKKLKKKQKKAAKKNLQGKSEDHSAGENESAKTSEKPNSPLKVKDAKVVSSKRKDLYKKKRQDFREKRKVIRQEEGLFSSVKKLSVDEMKEKIAEIESRETMSNSAKRKLRILKKKLGVEEGTFETHQNLKRKSDSVDQEKLKKNKKQKTDWSETISTIGNADKKGNKKNSNKKKEKLARVAVTKEQLFIEDKTGDRLADSSESHDEDDESPELVDNVANILKYANGSKLSEEDSEDEVEDEVEDDATEESEDEDDAEENESDEESDEEEQPTKQKKLNANLELKNKKGKQLDFKKENKSFDSKKQDKNDTGATNANGEKKQRYVVFVGNCAYDTTTVDLKKHFLTKVSLVKDVRIPLAPGTNKPRGFAYVELDNKEDYEKSLSLHGTSLNNRQIKVEYTTSGKKLGNKKQEIVHKNKKLHAMRKAGMLAGSKKDSQKRSFRRNFKKNPHPES